MARTASADVGALLGDSSTHSKNRGDWDGETSLAVYIASATVIVDQVVICAARKSITLSDAQLELIERWLAAHLYTKNDPIFQSSSLQGASASFVQGDEPERYKAGALSVDTSGCLDAVLNRKRARAGWLGKRPSEQTDYSDRR